MEPLWALGLMSGTSLDGVDAAWLCTDGQKINEVGGGLMTPYPPSLREKIRKILGQKDRTPEMRDIEGELTLFHVHVVKEALEQAPPIDLIGFHGHTVFHAPPETCQIGDGELLARELGIDVIYDFRTRDVAHGGQGAPLVPVFHQAMQQKSIPTVIVNLGGVANLTWICPNQPLFACDTGPGGALLDDWVRRHTGQLYDSNGHIGAQGTVNEAVIEQWFKHPYFAKTAPKSLDRNDFVTFLTDIDGLSCRDGAATLTELTARSIIHALTPLPEKPQEIYITGGGRRNSHLMGRLKDLAPCAVEPVEILGWNGDLLEAYAFAYLAVRVKAGLPTSFPTTTGVAQPMSGGQQGSGGRNQRTSHQQPQGIFNEFFKGGKEC